MNVFVVLKGTHFFIFIYILYLLVAAVSFLSFTGESRGRIMPRLCQPAMTVSNNRVYM